MLARPLSVAFVGTLALGAALLFGMSGCDQWEDWAHDFVDKTSGTGGAAPGGTGGASGGGAVTCASSESCPSGQICTTELGECDSPPGCGSNGNSGALVACPAVCWGVCEPKAPVAATCATDADCHLAADYCKGCECRALGSHETVPACDGAGVQCFADPCMQKTASCVNGACTVAAAPTR
jgi:hypothetical protein